MNAFLKTLAPVVLLALAACASPTPAPVLVTLPPVETRPMAGTVPPPSGAASMPMLAVRRVAVPEYLTVRRVRYRADAATLAEWPNTYWAERIEIGVTREFIASLRQQLPGWSTCESNCGEQAPSLAVQVDLVPMDYVRASRKLQAGARISVTSGDARAAVLAARELNLEIASDADTAQGQTQAIAKLVQQVAAETAALVRSLPQ